MILLFKSATKLCAPPTVHFGRQTKVFLRQQHCRKSTTMYDTSLPMLAGGTRFESGCSSRTWKHKTTPTPTTSTSRTIATCATTESSREQQEGKSSSSSLEDLLWTRAKRSLQGHQRHRQQQQSKSSPKQKPKSIKNKQKQTQKLQRNAKANVDAFHQYFCNVYGHDRWERLGTALLQPSRIVALLNVFATNVFATTTAAASPQPQQHEWLHHKVLSEPTTTRRISNNHSNHTQSETVQEEESNTTKIVTKQVEWAKPFQAYWVNDGTGRFEPPSPLSSVVSTPKDDNNINNNNSNHYNNVHLYDYYCCDPSSLIPVLALFNNIHHMDPTPTILPSVGTAHTNNDDEASLLSTKDITRKNSQQPISILDMCAAPGGKTLAILQGLHFLSKPDKNPSNNCQVHNNTLTAQNYVIANEFSKSRRLRLLQVLHNYIPRTLSNTIVTVQGRDGASYGTIASDSTSTSTLLLDVPDMVAPFSHVLCDVPCSGERHLVNDGTALGLWNVKQKKKNQKRQISLLKASVAACRNGGGIIVYSTCSIDPFENDVVVEKILSKRKDSVDIVKLNYPIGEPTKYGWIILPDHPSCEGLGPLYISALQKK